MNTISLLKTLTILLLHGFTRGQWDLFGRGEKPLAIDGSWSAWNDWSSCYVNTPNLAYFYPEWENFTIQHRNRTCNSPAPVRGGQPCAPPSHRFRQCSCDNPLGLSTGRIKQISASDHAPKFPPTELGLNSSGWCTRERISYFDKSYVEIDFENFVVINALQLIGNNMGRVSKYKLEHSFDRESWEYFYRDNAETDNIFEGILLLGEVKNEDFRDNYVMRYLRITPMEAFGLPCLKMEVYGCVYTCGAYFTKPFGEIKSQSMEQYDQNCLWKIYVANTTALSFDFNIFYLMCENGYVEFLDGNKPLNNSPAMRQVCLKNQDDEVGVIKLNFNNIWMRFVSNSSLSEDSFNLRYSSECKQEIYLEQGVPYEIQSPNYPSDYFDNLECEWKIYSPNGVTAVQISFKEFQVEGALIESVQCADDSLSFQSTNNGVTKSHGRFCDSNKPKPVYKFKAEQVLFLFKTDMVAARKGFSFDIKAGEQPSLTTSNPIFEGDTKTKQSPIGGPNKTNTVDEKKLNSTDDGGDEWTVIIIATFSAFLAVLLIYVVGNNIRQFCNNRSEVNAQCAKLALEAEKKEKKEKERESQALLSRAKSSPSKKVSSPSTSHDIAEVDEVFKTEGETAVDIDDSKTPQPSSPINVNVKISNSNISDQNDETNV